ncbi:MAG TPA: DNA polymerase I [Terriglobia bacterium]|nr:DNA polymerase I [Terriglobia bacterium]
MGSAAGSRDKLFLVDAMSLVFRAFFAPMQTALVSPAGIPTKAVYIFLRTLRKILKDHKPTHIAVVFDLAAPTFRDRLFETYKANRPAFPEDLTVQLPYVRRFCRALGLPIVEKEGFEADDVIGTLAREGEAKGLDVLIVTGDEDLFQLVGERTKVLKPSRGANEVETLCDEAKVKEILGVAPSEVIDWLALTGDSSDNIPGARPLPGKETPTAEGKRRSYIGPKGATDLIQRFGTLENVLASYDKVERQSYRDALRDFASEARLSKDLATIRTDVPLEVHVDDLAPSALDLPEVTALSQELGFTTLLKEFLEQAASAVPASAGVESEELRTPEAVDAWLKRLEPGMPVAVGMAVEGEEGFAGRLAALGLSDGRRVVTIPLGDGSTAAAVPAPLKALLSHPAHPKAVHNSKLLRLLLMKASVDLAGVADDTLLYSFLLEPLASSGLADIVLRRRGVKVSGSLAETVERTREMAALLAPELEREGVASVYQEIELPLSSVLADVEAAGVRIDPAIFGEMSRVFEGDLVRLTREIYDLAGGPFDIDSPKQLGEILFERLKLPGGKRLKKSGQYSTVASVLETLAEQHELPQKIIEYRTRTKLKSTYVDSLPRYIQPETGRLHTSFNQAGSRTGRLSSSNPNLQNIPIGDEFGLLIRSAFVAEPGWSLIAADYSQIELRVLAHMSEDPLLIEAFSRGEDIHSRTAQEIFGVPAALQTHEHRRVAKAINYGVIYGLSSFGLAARTGTSKTEAREYIDEYFKRYARVKQFLDGILEEARSTGRVRTLFGRFRPIPEIRTRDVPARNRAEREAMNAPLQGTAADLLKLAMIRVHDRLRRESMETRMILTVHDELVFESPEAEIERARDIVRSEMEGAYAMRVPLRVDLGVGKNWKEAK